MLKDDFRLKGRLAIAINDQVVKYVDNVVVTDGKEYVASRMKDTAATAMSHMAIGTGSTTAAASDTALGGEADRNSLTSTTVSGTDIVYVATFWRWRRYRIYYRSWYI